MREVLERARAIQGQIEKEKAAARLAELAAAAKAESSPARRQSHGSSVSSALTGTPPASISPIS
jgi:hypothetical protein